MYKPKKVCKFVVATAVLHNIRRSLKLDEDEEFLANDTNANYNDDAPVNDLTAQEIHAGGNEIRDEIRLNHFS